MKAADQRRVSFLVDIHFDVEDKYTLPNAIDSIR